MNVFLVLICLFALIIFGLLLYNELIFNNNRLDELILKIKKLQEDLQCANSGCNCERAVELKNNLDSLNVQYDALYREYTKIYKKYRIQYRIVKIFAKKLGITSFEEKTLL